MQNQTEFHHEDFQVLFKSESEDGFVPAAALVAYTSDSIAAIDFYDFPEESVIPRIRETRVFPYAGDIFGKFEPAELNERLARWVEHDLPHLPDVDTVEAPFTPRLLRDIPFAKMRRHAVIPDQQTFEAPSRLEAELAANNTKFRAAQGWTAASARAHLEQLRAVKAYVDALQEGVSPTQAVADALDVDPVRARNLIQFARKNGYLRGGSQGQIGGRATEEAFRLSEAARNVTEKGGQAH